MPSYSDGTKITQSEWSRLIESIPASYVIWKDGSTYRAECTLSGGTDYAESTFASAFQKAHDALANGGRIHIKPGAYQTATGITIYYQKIIVTGEGMATKIQPTADIDVFTISPSSESGEEGIGVKISDLYFYDYPSSPAQTSKAMIVLDNSTNKFSGVTLEDLTIQNCYDGIKNNRGSSDKDCWRHTLRNINIYEFRHHAIHWQNIADTHHSNLWMVSENASTVAGFLIERISGGSGKCGGCTFEGVRIFNEKSGADNAVGMKLIDTHEMWFTNCIFDFCNSHGFHALRCSKLFFDNCWFSANWNGMGCLIEADGSGTYKDIYMTNCYAWLNGSNGFTFRHTGTGSIKNGGLTNLNAYHNCGVVEDKYGIYLENVQYFKLVNCHSYDDNLYAAARQYGGISEDYTADYNTLIGCVAYGNTTYQIVMHGAHSHVFEPTTYADATLSGTAKIVEIVIGETPYYFKVYPTKS